MSTSTSTGGSPQMEVSPSEPREARLLRAPRCLALTRLKTLCQRPVIRGRKRCALHGCANGAGGRSGDRNGSWKHGGWTHEGIEERREASALLKTITEGVA